MNQNQTTNTNTINASATNGSAILGSDGKAQSQTTSKVLECLEAKLDLILANQMRLEQLLSAQSAHAVNFSQNAVNQQLPSINA